MLLTWHESYTLLATFTAIAVTLAGVIWSGFLTRDSNKITQDSNDLMKKDLGLRHRPWIIMSDPKLTQVWGKSGRRINLEEFGLLSSDKIDEFHPTQVEWTYFVENLGNTVALNFDSNSVNGKWNEILLEEFIKTSSVSSQVTQPIQPHQKKLYSIFIDYDDWDVQKNNTYWVGKILHYSFVDYKGDINIQTIRRILSFHNVTIWRENFFSIEEKFQNQ